MTPMAYAWTLFSGSSIIKRRLTWTNDDPFAGSEVYGDVYQVVGVPLYTEDECKARVEAAEKRVKELESEFNAMTVEMRAANIARVVEATGTDFVDLANRCEAAEDKLLTIRQWCEAYPLDIFPEPDHRKARALLEAGGMTLDAVSASAMRHVVTRLKETVDLKI